MQYIRVKWGFSRERRILLPPSPSPLLLTGHTGTDILMRSFILKHPRYSTKFLDQSKDSGVTSNQCLDHSAAWGVTSRDSDLSVLITLG